jgi:hypothetical protein
MWLSYIRLQTVGRRPTPRNLFGKKVDQKLYKVETENVLITKEGRTIAGLAKPSETPIADSLVGLLKNSGIQNIEDIKAIKLDT